MHDKGFDAFTIIIVAKDRHRVANTYGRILHVAVFGQQILDRRLFALPKRTYLVVRTRRGGGHLRALVAYKQGLGILTDILGAFGKLDTGVDFAPMFARFFGRRTEGRVAHQQCLVVLARVFGTRRTGHTGVTDASVLACLFGRRAGRRVAHQQRLVVLAGILGTLVRRRGRLAIVLFTPKLAHALDCLARGHVAFEKNLVVLARRLGTLLTRVLFTRAVFAPQRTCLFDIRRRLLATHQQRARILALVDAAGVLRIVAATGGDHR